MMKVLHKVAKKQSGFLLMAHALYRWQNWLQCITMQMISINISTHQPHNFQKKSGEGFIKPNGFFSTHAPDSE